MVSMIKAFREIISAERVIYCLKVISKRGSSKQVKVQDDEIKS